MPHITRIDRARGSMLGLAIGDAIGAPLEGLSTQQVRQAYGHVSDYVDGVLAWRRKPLRWRLKGLYSDDTQQALVLAECLIRHGRVDANWIATTYVALANPKGPFLGAHRGVGASFRQVINELELGASPDQTGQPSAGCGAAMRIAPLGLYYCDRSEEILPAVLSVSLMTHRDIRSLAAAVAVAHAVSRLARGDERIPSFVFRLAQDVRNAEDWIARHYPRQVLALREHRHAVSSAIARVEPILERPRDQAHAALIEEGNRHGPEIDCRRPTLGFAPVCLPTCLYVLLTTDSLEEALLEIVNLGGDADTAGAMLGAMAGAHYGAAAIPERWIKGLRNREGIVSRAAALLPNDKSALDAIPDLIETERRLTREEAAMREQAFAGHRKGDDLGLRRWER